MSETQLQTTIPAIEVAELDPVRLQMNEVEEHPDNPRVHSVAQIYEIKQSLIEHGYAAGTMVIQKSRMRLVKGHGVYKALLELGCRFADFVARDMTDEEALIFLMRDNRTSDLSSWHPTKFRINVQKLQKLNVKVTRIGFSMKQIKAMEAKAVDIDPDELNSDSFGSGKSMMLHICPKCGHQFHREEPL